MYLFLCWCNVLITLAFQFILKSEIVIPQVLVFIFKIVLAIWVLLWFHTNFRIIVVLFLNFFNVYLFLTERQSMNGGGSEREGDTGSERGSRL